MSGTDSIVMLSGCAVNNIGTYNSKAQWGKGYNSDRLEWRDETIGNWGAAVNNVFSDLFLTGCRDPHKKLCELFFAVINEGFVPLAWEKTLGAFADFEMFDETYDLFYKLRIDCRKCALFTPHGAEDLTWWVVEYFGDNDLLPKNVFLDSLDHTDDDEPKLMGKDVLQWNWSAVYLPEVRHPFARKICEISHQLQEVRVCS